MTNQRLRRLMAWCLVALVSAGAGVADTQAVSGPAVSGQAVSGKILSGEALTRALKRGGYVIVMRHASAPSQLPDRLSANPDNLTLERQLDATGRATARAMGDAFERLKIAVGRVFSSPTYRALETVRAARLKNPESREDLGDGGQGMRDVPDGSWLQQQVRQPTAGTNTLIVTHMPNISRAFPAVASVAEGEAIVFGLDETGAASIVARIKIEEWPTLR